jgi:hypothetical protein
MAQQVYLQILLFLKSTFDIFLSYKINFYQNWRRIYECLIDTKVVRIYECLIDTQVSQCIVFVFFGWN